MYGNETTCGNLEQTFSPYLALAVLADTKQKVKLVLYLMNNVVSTCNEESGFILGTLWNIR